MKKDAASLGIIIMVIFFSRMLPQLAAGGVDEDLSGLLERAAQYCEKVKKMALYYVCEEKIDSKEYLFKGITQKTGLLREERAFQVLHVKKKSFKYDYQLIKKDKKLEERRTLIEEDGKKQNIKNARLDRIKYAGKFLVFGPVGFLSIYWQDFFDYKKIGAENLNGKKVTVISAIPKADMDENNNKGIIWIDNKTGQILRIEWEPVSIRNYEEEEIDSPRGEFRKTVIWTVSYDVEKNGVRFPGKQTIREIFLNDKGHKALKREISFQYESYKFFIVETEVKYIP